MKERTRWNLSGHIWMTVCLGWGGISVFHPSPPGGIVALVLLALVVAFFSFYMAETSPRE